MLLLLLLIVRDMLCGHERRGRGKYRKHSSIWYARKGIWTRGTSSTMEVALLATFFSE